MSESPTSDGLWFPDPRTAVRGGRCDGLVAVGGELTVPRLLLAYRSGLFPWTESPVSWWSPDPRGVMELDGFHLSASLRRTLRKGGFVVTEDRAFREVVMECAAPAPGRERTWITGRFVEAYTALHQAGHAHSVECWQNGRLVGGIYGVAVGGCFSGESMFHRVSEASKVALHGLWQRLRERGFVLFDIQQVTRVTAQLGAVTLPREMFLERLAAAVALDVRF